MGRRLTARKLLFWLHLGTGVLAGLFLLSMALSGGLLATRPAALSWARRTMRVVPPAGAARLPLDSLLAQAVPADARISFVSLRREADAPVVVSLGKDRSLAIDPYRGTVLPETAAGIKKFYRLVEDWHRHLALEGSARKVGIFMTGATALLLLLLAPTGAVLWWPRHWTLRGLSARTWISWKGHGRARHWNWHNAAGFWGAPLLLATALTGVVMSQSQPWANALLFRLAGEAPAPAARRGGGRPGEGRAPRVSFEPLLAAAQARAPGWQSLDLWPPGSAYIREKDSPVEGFSILKLDPDGTRPASWEPYATISRGRRWRAWIRPIHTGEAAGPWGVIATLLCAAAAATLAFTGLSMAFRRIRPVR